MKVLFAIALFISIVSLISGGKAVWSKPCNPGDSWKDKCRTCLCDADGKATCSRQLCPGEGTRISLPPIKEKRQAPASQCVPGTYWQEDCNSCSCTPNGYKSCTRMECHSGTS